MVHALYFNAGHSPDKWCYAAETTADIYRFTLHSALDMSPYEAWYNVKPRIDDLCVWGCTVYVRNDSTKKSESRVYRGYFMGFTKSWLLIRWLDPTTNTVKHACAIRFDEHNITLTSTDTPSPGTLLLQVDPPTTIPSPEITIDIADHLYLESPIFSLSITLPPLGLLLGCDLGTYPYHNLPYISHFTKGSHLAQLFSPYGVYNSTFWILSLHSKEFSQAPSVASYVRSLQQQHTSTIITGYFAKRKPPTRSTFEENRAIFNQIKLSNLSVQPTASPCNSIPIPVPMGMTVVITPVCPIAPNHIGKIHNNPYYADWKSSLFKNDDKMLSSGTWSAPMLRSTVPPNKTVLQNRVTFKVKDTDLLNTYELYGRTCANGSPMKENVDYTDSYSPVGSIDSIRLILAIAASKRLHLNVLDISNAFQTSIIFDPSECTYITLPPFYLEWFHEKWPDYKLPSLLPKDLVIRCLRCIQGTKDAGHHWYKLLRGKLCDIGMSTTTIDHGVFIWEWSNHFSVSILETDDLLMASDTDAPFHHLRAELQKMFDLTCKQGSILKFLNLHLIQSPNGVSIDQTQHIKTHVLDPYFTDVPPTSIPHHYYPFPIEASFEQMLYEAPPLTGIDLQQVE
jgi:hypothetical protein